MKVRSDALRVQYEGLTWLAHDLAKVKGVSYSTLRRRIKRGVTGDALVAKPFSRKLAPPRFADRFRGLM